MNVKQMVRAEQGDLRDLLAGLTDEQWDTSSLCAGWRVHDVIAHLVSINEAGPLAFVKARFSIDRFNAMQVKQRAALGTDDLLDAFGSHMGISGVGRFVPALSTLTDILVHHQDIRRPLEVPREIPEDRLRAALSTAFSPITDPLGGGHRRARGLRLDATDIDFSRGKGLVVRGPAEALVMAVMGRRIALDELSGEGKDILAQRV